MSRSQYLLRKLIEAQSRYQKFSEEWLEKEDILHKIYVMDTYHRPPCSVEGCRNPGYVLYQSENVGKVTLCKAHKTKFDMFGELYLEKPGTYVEPRGFVRI